MNVDPQSTNSLDDLSQMQIAENEVGPQTDTEGKLV